MKKLQFSNGNPLVGVAPYKPLDDSVYAIFLAYIYRGEAVDKLWIIENALNTKLVGEPIRKYKF